MKFRCLCGETIRDQTDYLEHKAWVLRDQDDERFGQAVEDEVAAFLAAVRAGSRAAWLAERPHLGNQSDAAVIGAIALFAQPRFMSVAYECPACGRLYLDRTPGSIAPAVIYVPASGTAERTFASALGAPQPGGPSAGAPAA